MNLLIIGMPNVGKSSLYNIMTNNNQNIIHETVGTTRDWHVASFKNNSNINVFDTPGLTNFKKNIDKKLLDLINDIDLFLYVVDYKSESFFNDKELISILRKFNKQIILIVNKDDNNKQNKNFDFLGLENIYHISCSHKLGIDKLLKFLSNFNIENKSIKKINFTIGLFGKTNVGKSTLLNKLVGFNRSVVSDKPKTTTDIVLSSFKYKNNEYSIKDTAGLIKKNKIDKNSLDYYVTKKTLSIIKDLDITLFLLDIQQGFDNQSKKIFNLIFENSNIIILLINKIDLIKINKKKIISKLKKDIELEFSQSKNIFIIPISNLYPKDIIYLKKYIHKLTFEVNKVISTSQINQWMKKTINNNPHSRIKGKEVKFKYATQISNNPLTIKIFSNFTKEISNHYRRFLLNSFYEFFNIKSKKVKIIFSKSSNPYT